MKHNIYILLHACSATVRFLHSWADLSTCFSKSGLSCFSFSGFWRNQPSLPWHTLAGLEAGINFFSFLYFFYSRAFLTSSRFLFASHSEKLAISICAPFLCAQHFPIREPFWKARDLHSRAFLCAQRCPISKPFWKARYLFAIREPF